MEIVDLQLHDPALFGDWDGDDVSTRHRAVTEALLQMMDAVGVDAVVLHPTDESGWAEHLAGEFPGRFSSVPVLHAGKPWAIQPDAPDIEERLAAAFDRPGVVGIRFIACANFYPEEHERLLAGGFDRAFAACERQGIPVFLMATSHAEAVGPVARAFPELQLILDHIGLPQPPMERPDEPRWKRLPDVVALAEYPNVAIKLCGAPALAAEPYPFAGAWPYVHQLLEAFGPERLAWASDIGRFRGRIGSDIRVPGSEQYLGKHNYRESLGFILHTDELSADEKRQILGATARSLLAWPAPTA